MYTFITWLEEGCPCPTMLAFLASLFFIFTSADSAAQIVAGRDANPLPRMNCAQNGDIRNDSGSCVPVANYFSTGSNKIKWVDQNKGSDANSGTASKPWKTIGRSTKKGVLRPGDVVIIRGGTYRETIAPTSAGKAGQLITFAAYPGEEVVISGVDPMNSGWTRAGNAWKHTWTHPLPAEPNVGTLEERPEFRREMVVIDGTVLTPVFSRAEVVPGTFYAAGSDDAPTALFMRLPGDDNPDGHAVEVGYRSALFLPLGSREDWCGNNYGHYRLVGLTFRHAVNNASWSAVCTGNASLLEENIIEWTNGSGIYVAGTGNVLRGNRADYNGMRGIGGRCESCSILYNETSYNNWKKHAYGYGAGGIKLIYSTDTVVGHHLSVGNDGVGIWFDVDNHDNIIENSVSMFNMGRGIMLEHGTVRTLVRNNVVYGTKLHPTEGTGIQTQAASHNTIVHNTIVANEGYGIYIRTSPRNDDGYNKIYNNLLIRNVTGGNVGHTEIRIDGYTMAHARTNRVDGNMYWPHNKIGGNTFMLKTDDGDVHRGNNISDWRGWINDDASASTLDTNVKQVKNDGSPSGWSLVGTSEAIGKGVALPTGVDVLQDIEAQTRPLIFADVGADQYEGDVGKTVGGFLSEHGSVSVRQSGPNQWHTVSLDNVYVEPVVVMSPLSYNGGNPSTLRVRNVTAASFEFQIDEWDYLDGKHAREEAHYVVFEAGHYSLGNGNELEAGLIHRNSSFAGVSFKQSFGSTPVVLSQIVSVDDGRAAVTRQRNVSSSGFDVALQGQQSDASHALEKVAYVAITKGSGTIGTQSFYAGIAPSGVDEQFYAMDLGKTFPSAPVFLASMQSTNGGHTAALRYRNLTGSSVEAMVEEEQSKDAETSHKKESIGYLVIGGGFDLNLMQVTSSEALNQRDLDQSLPTSVELNGNYPNPFNPVTTIRYALPEAADVRLEVFDVMGRRVAVLVDERRSAGAHEAKFDAGALASGTYLYRLQAGSQTKVSRMILIK